MKFCNYPYNSIAIVDDTGLAKPCCVFLHDDEDDWKDYRIDNLDVPNLNHFIKSSLFGDIRKNIGNTKEFIPECENCKAQEDINMNSKRLWYNETFPMNDPLQLEDMEIALDYTCNMMCRICRPGQSSKWKSAKTLVEQVIAIDPEHNSALYKSDNLDYKKHMDRLISASDFSKLKRVRFVGGEPFYSKSFNSFIEKVDREAGIENMSIYFNTNGSIFPKKEIIDKLLTAKELSIAFSIDAIGELASVIRYGVEWEVIDANVKKWVELRKQYPNLKLSIHSTISVLNVNAFQPLFDYMQLHDLRFSYYVLRFPEYLSLYHIPKPIRQLWKVKNSIPEHEYSEEKMRVLNYILDSDRGHTNEHAKFIKTMDVMDKYQEKSFKVVNSQIYNIMQSIAEDQR